MLGFSVHPHVPVVPMLIASTLSACTLEQSALGDRSGAQVSLAGETQSTAKESRICADRSTPAGTDKYCVSSVLKGDPVVNRFTYGPASLFDDAESTAWVEGVDGQGIGEWITVEFDQIRLVKAIEINNGYNKDRDIYLKNGRVKGVRVEFSRDRVESSRDDKKTLVLKDTSAMQPIPLPKDQPLKAYKIKFTIESVYPGTKWEDTAISELHIVSEPANP